MRKSIVYIILILITSQLFAGINDLQFKRLDVNNGLSSNQINSIFKDSRGYLWIGTVNGLNRFDGYSSKIFRKSNDKPGTISNNTISNIFEDNRGKIWVTTISELNIYDPETEQFSTDDPIFHKNIEIPKQDVLDVIVDKLKNLWIIHRSTGLYKYDPKTDKVSRFALGNNGNRELMPFPITDVTVGPDGCFWLINQGLAIEKFDPVSFQVVKRFDKISQNLISSSFDYNLFVDKDEDVWIYSRNEQEGALLFNPRLQSFTEYSTISSTNRISNNTIVSVIQDNNGKILVGTDHGGLNVIDKRTQNIQIYTNDPGDKNSISQNSIVCLYKDNSNIIWIGTYKKGVSFYHPDLFKFLTYCQHPFKQNWLDYEDVNSFAEDRLGNLWIGSNGGGLIYFDRQKNSFKTYKHSASDPNSLSNDVIVDLCIDHAGGLWIGTYMGGLNYFDGTKFVRYLNDPKNINSIASNQIWSIFEDSNKQLWIGTLGSGVDIFDRSQNRFIHHQVGSSSNTISSNYIMSISENRDKNMWFATIYGVDVFDKASGRFIHFMNNPETNSLSSNSTLDVYCDSRGWVWIATRDGLNMYDPKIQKFTILTEKDGLPGSNIFTIMEDKKGNMWLGTPQGLCNLIITNDKTNGFSFSVKNYDEKDGLHGRAFNEHAALKTKEGELVFGGVDGFSIFKPENLTITTVAPTIIFSDFEVQNKPVDVGQEIDKRVLLDKSLNDIEEISLKHFEKTFSISFASLNFFNPEKTLYHYQMEGFSSDWVVANSSSRKVTYTNLHPGDYIFKVYASDFDNSLKSNVIELKIKVLPPFWATKWAYSLYLIIVLVSIFYAIQSLLKKVESKYLLQKERIETAKVHEMDMLKLKFFTNISHEFRTPLTLILTPLEKIIRTTENGQNKEQLKLVQRNAKRLLNLVNQLLDFRKLEIQGLSLVVSNDELIRFCREATESFSDLSDSRNIKLTFTSNVKELKASLDFDKIEKILFNLLSNAFKFTPEKGSISVSVFFDEAEKQVKISVADTGIGIQQDKQDAIFERFVQNIPEGSTVNKGSGIGLSLTREFVQMHDGKITLESTVGKGSCFEVVIPLKDHFEIQNLPVNSPTYETDLSKKQIEGETENDFDQKREGKFKLLLVEDNPDIRFYLKDNFKSDYAILEATNGQEAWDIIIKDMPDLVVTDIMMPVMDGMELCGKIKTDNRTSHIPVIMLTARTTDLQKYEGLETGADAYVTKPFNFEILELRIKNLIEQRNKLRQLYQKNFDLQPTEIAITSLDDKFLKKIKQITEDNMDDPNFSVEKLSSEFGISRAHLYNKLVALTGKTPIEFIRILRIRRSAQLLEKSQLTVMEIAYKVGFNDPRYFTKHFKSEYNMTPSQYAKKHFTESNPSSKEL
jgi:signal transduction histidine kinase/ligand-binding sensor domain-containing protein/DNA-binding response OmpR family regulator